MKLGIIIYTAQYEAVYNAFRIANFALKKGDSVKVFLLGEGVESVHFDSIEFDVKNQISTFQNANGEILACGTCLDLRNSKEGDSCKYSNLSDLYEIVVQCDKVLSF
ncbi:sulfur reduction protein DsrE [Leptospira yasudae]|uniref:Sulfur reduction protein DsrE n=1 Tax=Leptospira yasudae TaxID=2202201 RepID=A0ABX9M6L0_9LEPT|nr:DsrE family protein [Leptospira yasudae]RHX81549.1 sulfur reduction protein DsrE [Leptospira yasudae]RHX95911.1 sulfur reduction protein DsrE [Leptospira yasudae]